MWSGEGREESRITAFGPSTLVSGGSFSLDGNCGFGEGEWDLRVLLGLQMFNTPASHDYGRGRTRHGYIFGYH